MPQIPEALRTALTKQNWEGVKILLLGSIVFTAIAAYELLRLRDGVGGILRLPIYLIVMPGIAYFLIIWPIRNFLVYRKLLDYFEPTNTEHVLYSKLNKNKKLGPKPYAEADALFTYYGMQYQARAYTLRGNTFYLPLAMIAPSKSSENSSARK
ncbi:hypothetical protein E5K00_19490 [Hymenobacter aquaticus]|uniref:Uncharacterized protein n=1 Tax=Hymenobacter aquaticus TaxID=1867101 RepID=A0A4Z0PYA6_9BACT|nr:hypothetical protein [Hymenobacter aquaticus]TGE22425.1 hypothetical protein E5K00_19490 [Hymenobacter aquaticus]